MTEDPKGLVFLVRTPKTKSPRSRVGWSEKRGKGSPPGILVGPNPLDKRNRLCPEDVHFKPFFRDKTGHERLVGHKYTQSLLTVFLGPSFVGTLTEGEYTVLQDTKKNSCNVYSKMIISLRCKFLYW